jgi:hypothetical protein
VVASAGILVLNTARFQSKVPVSNEACGHSFRSGVSIASMNLMPFQGFGLALTSCERTIAEPRTVQPRSVSAGNRTRTDGERLAAPAWLSMDKARGLSKPAPNRNSPCHSGPNAADSKSAARITRL